MALVVSEGGRLVCACVVYVGMLEMMGRRDMKKDSIGCSCVVIVAMLGWRLCMREGEMNGVWRGGMYESQRGKRRCIHESSILRSVHCGSALKRRSQRTGTTRKAKLI